MAAPVSLSSTSARLDTHTADTPTTEAPVARTLDPRLVAAAGSVCIASSPILVALAHVSPGTATLYRCLLALPVLAPLAWWEMKRSAARPGRGEHRRGERAGRVTEPGRRRPWLLLLGGVLLGLDMTLWSDSVAAVGAGVSTVFANVQVVILPLLAYLVLGERVQRSFLLVVPVMLVGVALAGGLAGHAATGPDPVRGTVTGLLAACAYAGYLLLVRLGAGRGERFTSVGFATLGAAASALVLGSFWQGVDLAPGWVALGWLLVLAIIGQVVGWVLIASALPRLSSAEGASILLLQPVGAVLLGVAVLGQVPTALQALGCAVVIGAVVVASRARRTRRAAEVRPGT